MPEPPPGAGHNRPPPDPKPVEVRLAQIRIGYIKPEFVKKLGGPQAVELLLRDEIGKARGAVVWERTPRGCQKQYCVHLTTTMTGLELGTEVNKCIRRELQRREQK